MTVKIKQLEWDFDGDSYVGTAGELKQFVTVTGNLNVPYRFGLEDFSSLDEAKARAQESFERVIRSTLLSPEAPTSLPEE